MLSPKQTIAGRESVAAGTGGAAGAGVDSAFGAGGCGLPHPHIKTRQPIKQNLSI
jgi:hypothetical protein